MVWPVEMLRHGFVMVIGGVVKVPDKSVPQSITGFTNVTHSAVSGESSEKISGVIEVGAKTVDYYPGVGLIKVVTTIEGEKLVNRGVYNGIQIDQYVYAARDTLTMEFLAGGAKAKSVAKKM